MTDKPNVAQAEAETLVERKCTHCGATDVGFGCITQVGALDCPRYAPALLARIAALEAKNAAKSETIKLQDAELDRVCNAMRALGKQLAEAGIENDTLSRQVQGMREALKDIKQHLIDGQGEVDVLPMIDAVLSLTPTSANK